MPKTKGNSLSRPRSCKLEGNLLEYPIFYFGDRNRPKEMSFRFEEERDAKSITRKVTVGFSGSCLCRSIFVLSS